MSRFLFVALPLTGHMNAPLAVSQQLVARGHDVAWCGPETYLRPLVGAAAAVYPTGMRLYREQNASGLAGLTLLWERYLVPFARFVLPAVDRAVLAYRPDLLVVDQHAFAGALVAYRRGVCWASLAPGALELTRPFQRIPAAQALVARQLARLWEIAGVRSPPALDLRFSPQLVVAFTAPALTGAAALPDNCVLVGPALGARPADPAFDRAWLDPGRRHVLVTMGTLADAMTGDFYRRALDAVVPLGDRLQAVVVADPGELPDPPPHVLIAPRVPMLDLMPHLDAVVCHAGMGTVGEALAHGVPLVVAPIHNDQPIVARQVVAARAGIRVPFMAVRPHRLREAIHAVLAEPGYRDAARRVGEEFVAAGGAAAAAAHLATLAARRTVDGSGWVDPAG